MSLVEQVLDRRREQSDRQGRWATAASLFLHASLAAALVLVPKLLADKPKPLKFVTVEVLPLQALGQTEPPPKPAPRRREPPPRPEPEPPPPAPQPEPRPAPPPPASDPQLPTLTREQPAAAEPAPPVPDPPPPALRQGSEHGAAQGAAAFGAAVAGLDNPDFTYGYYVDRMVALIRSRWHRPASAPGTETAVHFRILKDGSITELEVRSPSGDALFDRAAVRAVQEASPLPPLPVGYRQDSLGVSLIVR